MKIPTALALFPMALGAVEVDLEFTILNDFPLKLSQVDVTYKIGTNFNDPSTIKTYNNSMVYYSGNLLATASVDIETGNVDSLEFTGGSILTPNISALLQPHVGSVSNTWTATLTTSGVTRTPTGTIVPNSGEIYTTTFTDGSFTAANAWDANSSYNYFYNHTLATDGTYLIGPNIIASATFEFEETDSTSLSTSHTAELESLIRLTGPQYLIPIGGYPNYFTHTYNELGQLYAAASYSVPTAYGQWALDNDLDLTTGEEENAAGIPYALLYAFGLPADAASLPLVLSSTLDPTVELTLPDSGLGFTVEVEYAEDPAGPYTPLPDENFLSGTDSLDAGMTAPATLSYPAGAQGYLRFFVTL